jgi:hypothetical protein
MSDFEDEAPPPPPEEDNDGPVWVPTMLEETRERVATAKRDAAQAPRTCMLCVLATGETGCALKFSEILNFERQHRRNMQPDILHQALCDKYNTQIVRMLKERFPQRNDREMTLPEVRQHFQGNHDRDPRRYIEDRLEYLKNAAAELERSGLWLHDAKKIGRAEETELRPDFKNWDIYLKMTAKMRDLYRDMSGLGVNVSVSRVGKGSAGR